MLQVSSKDFQMHCSKMMRLAETESQEIIITKYGTPFLKVTPIKSSNTLPIWGCMEGTSKQINDIIDPIDEEWTFDIDNIDSDIHE